MPSSITAVAVTEDRKNLSAASAPRPSRRSATRAKAGSEATSRAITRVARSREAGSSAAPVALESSRNQYSPPGSSSRSTVWADSRAAISAPPSASSWKTSAKWSAT